MQQPVTQKSPTGQGASPGSPHSCLSGGQRMLPPPEPPLPPMPPLPPEPGKQSSGNRRLAEADLATLTRVESNWPPECMGWQWVRIGHCVEPTFAFRTDVDVSTLELREGAASEAVAAVGCQRRADLIAEVRLRRATDSLFCRACSRRRCTGPSAPTGHSFDANGNRRSPHRCPSRSSSRPCIARRLHRPMPARSTGPSVLSQGPRHSGSILSMRPSLSLSVQSPQAVIRPWHWMKKHCVTPPSPSGNRDATVR